MDINIVILQKIIIQHNQLIFRRIQMEHQKLNKWQDILIQDRHHHVQEIMEEVHHHHQQILIEVLMEVFVLYSINYCFLRFI